MGIGSGSGAGRGRAVGTRRRAERRRESGGRWGRGNLAAFTAPGGGGGRALGVARAGGWRGLVA